MNRIVMTALPGLPHVKPGDDVAAMIVAASEDCEEPLQDGDVVVVAQKIISKAEGRTVALRDVAPDARALELAVRCQKDPRQIAVVLDQSAEVLRARPGVIIVALHNGMVLANAGVDRSNVEGGNDDTVLLLPSDPDASAEALRRALKVRTGADVGVIIADSIGRAWRLGTVGTAIGAAGVVCRADLRGRPDLYGRPLETTEVGAADELAAAASILMGQAAEGFPVVVIRGAGYLMGEGRATDLVRPVAMDMFR